MHTQCSLTNDWVINKIRAKRELLDTVKTRKLATTVIPGGNKEIAWKREIMQGTNARWTQARKATHGLDRQHQDVDRTPCGRVNQNYRGLR